jgi:hypothetical protein
MNIVNLAAGSGKTTSALTLAKDLIKKGFNVTYTSITNVSVEDAKHRFTQLFSEELSEEQIANFKISTVHSYCLELIRHSQDFRDIEILTTTEYIPLPKECNVLENNTHIGEFKKFLRSKIETVKTRKVTMGTLQNVTVTHMHSEGTTIDEYVSDLGSKQVNILEGENGEALQPEQAPVLPDAKPEVSTIEKKQLVLPLDWVLHICKAYKLTPPQNDAIMIDEYQDMDAKELYALSEIFEDRAWLFGDPNQVLYIFRIKDGVYKPIDNVTLEKVHTHRFDQYSCDILSRLLTYKNSLLPIGSSPAIAMQSTKELTPGGSMELIDWNLIVDASKEFKTPGWRNYVQNRKIYEPLEAIIAEGHDSFQIITSGNGIASKYSEIIMKKYGDILTSWYVPVYSHPMYRRIRDCLRGHDNRKINIKLARAVHKTLTKLGYKVALTQIGNMFHYIQESGNIKAGIQVPDSDWLAGAILKLGDRYLDNRLKVSFKASGKSNFQSTINVLQMISTRGLKCAMSGVQLQSETPKRGRVTTIHTSKGTESDYVLLDIQGQFRPPGKIQELLQNLNCLYVGMSRHKKKLWITMDDYYKELTKGINIPSAGQVYRRSSSNKNEQAEINMIRAFNEFGIRREWPASEIDNDNIFGTAQPFYADLISGIICMSMGEYDPKETARAMYQVDLY